MILFSSCPDHSYLPSIESTIFNTVNNSDVRDGGHMRVSTHVYAEATHVMDLRRDRKRSLKLQEYTKAQDAQERKQNHHEIEVQSRALAHFVCRYTPRGMSLPETSSFLGLCLGI